MNFLHEKILEEFGWRGIEKTQIPKVITENLNPAFEMRPYQEEAFKRFKLFIKKGERIRPSPPYHINFNMATGSGKTYIMAGLILYLFEQGYRNFIFFVTSNNIIKKTKDNFLNSASMKYLFARRIFCHNKEIFVKEITSLDEADTENINIHFTTIHQLHQDLILKQKENSPTFEDFKGKNFVLLADEAHHFNVATKNQTLAFDPNWENTVLKILESDIDNLLLEFTATLELENPDILKKYINKIIFKYDLNEFHLQKYSKEIMLLRSNMNQNERILQAVILSQYRQEVATQYGVDIKPVMLFKAKRTIDESEQNRKNFHILIDQLSARDIKDIAHKSNIPVIQKAFTFFQSQGISDELLVERLRSNFDETKCLSANNESEKEKNQILLNSLEDKNNPIRVIFAVQKLNEGWDVLNLFDIVRLYEGRDGRNNRPGKTTISEAQLIGRGARYFPFTLNEGENKFKRKFDDNINHEIKILEELHYHTVEDSRYISELKTALIETGIYEDNENLIDKELKLKENFKEKSFYKKGCVFTNEKVVNNFSSVRSFHDLGVKKKNFEVEIFSGAGYTEGFFEDTNQLTQRISMEQKEIELKNIPHHIIRRALANRPFFNFDHLKKYFPNLDSMSEFISSGNYLSGLFITFKANKKKLQEISNQDYYLAISGLLVAIENEIKTKIQEYIGTTDFRASYIKDIFKNKVLRINKNDERSQGQENFLSDKDWYVYNANYGTSEEKAFVEMFARRYEFLEKDFNDIYLIRNERAVKIYNFKDGKAFEPDYILFVKQKPEKTLIYQIFIEPKGRFLLEQDRWKESFLRELRKKDKTIKVAVDQYKITGVPFYNNQNENEFSSTFEKILANR